MELIEKAKRVLRYIEDIRYNSGGNYVGEACDIRNVCEDFLDNLPKEILQIIEERNRAIAYLDDIN